MPTNEDLAEEDNIILRLRYCVDLTVERLKQRVTTREEGLLLIEEARDQILQVCPDKAHVFELVLRPRFMRILNETVRQPAGGDTPHALANTTLVRADDTIEA
jgi:hypothetical protein